MSMDRKKIQRMAEKELMLFDKIKWCNGGSYNAKNELHKLDDNIYFTCNFMYDKAKLGFVSSECELFVFEDGNYHKIGEFKIGAKPIVDKLLNKELERANNDKDIETYKEFIKVNNFLIF